MAYFNLVTKKMQGTFVRTLTSSFLPCFMESKVHRAKNLKGSVYLEELSDRP